MGILVVAVAGSKVEVGCSGWRSYQVGCRRQETESSTVGSRTRTQRGEASNELRPAGAMLRAGAGDVRQEE